MRIDAAIKRGRLVKMYWEFKTTGVQSALRNNAIPHLSSMSESVNSTASSKR